MSLFFLTCFLWCAKIKKHEENPYVRIIQTTNNKEEAKCMTMVWKMNGI